MNIQLGFKKGEASNPTMIPSLSNGKVILTVMKPLKLFRAEEKRFICFFNLFSLKDWKIIQWWFQAYICRPAEMGNWYQESLVWVVKAKSIDLRVVSREEIKQAVQIGEIKKREQ